MKDYEKLSESLDKKMLDFNLKILTFLGSILIRPLALCTEAVFRRNLGERYFTLTTFVYSFFLWAFASMFVNLEGGLHWDFLRNHGLNHLANWLSHQTNPGAVKWFVGVTFFSLSANNLSLIWKRHKDGIPWYSMSRGESVFGTENRMKKASYISLIGVGLFILTPPFGLLYFASCIASLYLFSKEQESKYANFLDEQDADILAGNLEPAMIGNKQPRETSGVYCPLPGRFKGERRAHVAKVSGEIMARSAARRGTGAVKRPEVASAATSHSVPSLPPPFYIPWQELKEAWPVIKLAGPELVALARRYRRLAVIVLLTVALVEAGILVVRFIKTHQPPPGVAPVAQAGHAQPPTAIPATPPPAGAEFQNPAPATAPVTKPPQASLETPESQTRRQIIDQIKSSLASEATKVAQFRSASETALVDISRRYAAADIPDKSTLWTPADQIASDMLDVVKAQENYLNFSQSNLPAIRTTSKTEQRKMLAGLETKFVEMESARQEINRAINALDLQIPHATR